MTDTQRHPNRIRKWLVRPDSALETADRRRRLWIMPSPLPPNLPQAVGERPTQYGPEGRSLGR